MAVSTNTSHQPTCLAASGPKPLGAMVKSFIVCLLLAAVTMTAAPSHAISIYPPASSVTVVTDRQVYFVDQTVVITATACAVGDLVTFTIVPSSGGSPVVLTGVAVASGAGAAAVVTTVAVDKGAYQVTSTCAGKSAQTTFTVVTVLIPETGSDVSGVVTIAALVLLVGIGLFFVARLRRRPIER